MKREFKKGIIAVKAVGEMLFLYGLLGWTYGVAVQFLYPKWLPGPISHLTPDLRLDTFTIMSFVVSAVGFFVWRLTKELTNTTYQYTH